MSAPKDVRELVRAYLADQVKRGKRIGWDKIGEDWMCAGVELERARAGKTYYSEGKDADWFERLSDADAATALIHAAQDLNDTGMGDEIDRFMPHNAMMSGAGDRIRRLLAGTAPEADGEIERLRAAGWMVAVHNDYRLVGKAMTFWLFTHPDGRWVKGEGATDAEALAQCAALARPQPYHALEEAKRIAAKDERRLLLEVESETPPLDTPRDGYGCSVYMTWETIDRLQAFADRQAQRARVNGGGV